MYVLGGNSCCCGCWFGYLGMVDSGIWVRLMVIEFCY